MLNRIRQWLGSSNRLLHALGGLIVGLILGLRAALATAAGGLLGGAVQALTVYFIVS